MENKIYCYLQHNTQRRRMQEATTQTVLIYYIEVYPLGGDKPSFNVLVLRLLAWFLASQSFICCVVGIVTNCYNYGWWYCFLGCVGLGCF